MQIEELTNKKELLTIENENLKKQLLETTERLNKYLLKNKINYQQNKEYHKQRVKEYKEKNNYRYEPSPEQKKKYARTAYLKKKEKLKKAQETTETEEKT